MKNIFLTLFLLAIVCAPSAAAAQVQLETGLPNIPGNKLPAGSELPSYINYLFVFGLGAITILALARMMTGGIKYILAAGNVGEKADAKDTIQQALLGLGLLLASYLLLNTINPDLVKLRYPSMMPKIEYQGTVPMNMSVEEYLNQFKKQGKTPSLDMSPEDKKVFARENKDWLESDQVKSSVENMLKELSKKPNGSSIDLPLGHATKGVDFLTVCNPKCTIEALRE